MTRGWITFDGKEIADFSNIEWLMQHGNLANQIRHINHTPDFANPAQKTGYYLAAEEAKVLLQKEGVFSRDQFYDSLEEYTRLSIDAALHSQNQIIEGIAMLDRRFGVRRLKALKLPETAVPFVRACYWIRSVAEDIQVAE